jgi:hypothetical protein
MEENGEPQATTLFYQLIISHLQDTKITILYMHVVIMHTDMLQPLYNFKY